MSCHVKITSPHTSSLPPPQMSPGFTTHMRPQNSFMTSFQFQRFSSLIIRKTLLPREHGHVKITSPHTWSLPPPQMSPGLPPTCGHKNTFVTSFQFWRCSATWKTLNGRLISIRVSHVNFFPFLLRFANCSSYFAQICTVRDSRCCLLGMIIFLQCPAHVWREVI